MMKRATLTIGLTLAVSAALNLNTTAIANPARTATAEPAGHGTCAVNTADRVIARGAEKPGTYRPAALKRMSPLEHLLAAGRGPVDFCFAPGTRPEVMAYYNQLMQTGPEGGRYFIGGSWPVLQGTPISLTWSLVPDGVEVDGAPNELHVRLNELFGSQSAWEVQIQASFDRWEELTGVSFAQVPDDGASWGSDGGPTRGDVRIAMIPIDGLCDTLAYAYGPPVGEIVLDREETWALATDDYKYMRNVMTHEMGHLLGLLHVCPNNGTKLMEPLHSMAFDGPQHDDIRAVQYLYGDRYEPSDTTAEATALGVAEVDTPLELGPVPDPATSNSSLLSIDGDGDEDFFAFSIAWPVKATVTVTPVGTTYDAAFQGYNGVCDGGNEIDSLAIADLNVELIDWDGSTVLASATVEPAGVEVTLWEVELSTAETYYIHVYEDDVPAGAQLYKVTVTIEYPDCNENSIPDPDEIVGNPDLDCNGNGWLDECEISDGAPDCDGDGTLDECETDTDGDDTPDDCDNCPNDPHKTEPGICGCGLSDDDSDDDGVPDACGDDCPIDPDKTTPGLCGCNRPDTDSDQDGTPDCQECADDSDSDGVLNCDDYCFLDPDKSDPGICGCGNPDTDSDNDTLPDCVDGCPNDPDKFVPAVCGCGVPDTDSDGDGPLDCEEACPSDPNKTAPGECGCGNPDTDSDGDGVADCVDGCPSNPAKTDPGVCGCDELDLDSDADGLLDCEEDCSWDPNKTERGECGCGVEDLDFDCDGTPDCFYNVIDLGSLGGDDNVATGLNNADSMKITGWAETGDVIPDWGDPILHAFLWYQGELTDIGTLSGYNSIGNDVNDSGVVVGTSWVENPDHPGDPSYQFMRGFKYSGGALTELGPGSDPDHEDWWTWAFDINNAGQVAGQMGIPLLATWAVRWSAGGGDPLEFMPNEERSEAYGINEAGHVVGRYRPNGSETWYAFLWDGELTNLGLGTNGYSETNAYDLNANGWVVGYGRDSLTDEPRAFLYREDEGEMRDLGALGGEDSVGYAVNDCNQIVGWARTFANAKHAFLYQDGRMHDLNNFLVARQGWRLTAATDINENGQIVGWGLHNDEERAFLLTPGRGPDCNANGIPDECDISCTAAEDCNIDGCGTSVDCDNDGTPDECEPDCNTNGVPDDTDIAAGTSNDCNDNAVPDECEPDCNDNGVADACDISGATSEDCQPNGIPDDCELTGTNDCNGNDVPDECEDCNKNGLADQCDVPASSGYPDGLCQEDCSADLDENGIPDECQVLVTEVSSHFVSPDKPTVHFLDGVSLSQTFTATVEWGLCTPGTVEFITPRGTHIGNGGGATWTCVLDMGSDFGENGSLTVVAKSGDNPPLRSANYVVKLKVIPIPPGMPTSGWSVTSLSNTVKYSQPKTGLNVGDDIVPGASVPKWLPIIGGKSCKLGLSASILPEVTGDGKATAGFAKLNVGSPDPEETKPKFKFAGKHWGRVKSRGLGGSVGFNIGGKATWDYAGDHWTPGGSLDIGLNASANVPPKPIQYYVVVPLGPLPIPIPVGYLQGNFGMEFGASAGISDWSAPLLPQFNTEFTITPKGGGRIGLGLADVVAGEFSVGGKFPIVFQYPAEPTFKSFKAALQGSLRIIVGPFHEEWPVLDYEWDLYTGGTDPLAETRRGGFDLSGFTLIPRDYLRFGYAKFHSGDHSRGPRDACAGTTEQMLQSNVYPYPEPALVGVGNDGRLVWIYDDPMRTSINRTELVFSVSSNGIWSSPVAVADDGTADLSPMLAALPGGDLLAAWENADVVLPDETDLETMLSHLEIAVAEYDEVGQTWSSQTFLTSNDYLDRSPRLSAADNGLAMLAWVSNAANDPVGSSGLPNVVNYTLWDGSSWSAPGVAATGVPSIIKSDMAFDGSEALYLYSADTDDDQSTDGDQEIYAISFDGVAWSAPQRLTNDLDTPDGNPQVVATGAGQFLFAWYRGGEIVTATNLDLSDLTVALVPEAAGAAIDFRLVRGPGGELALVWQSASTEGVDIWWAVYDPGLDVWSGPLQLTFDDPTERWMAPTYLADGDLMIAYGKQSISYTTATLNVDGEEIVIDNVPVPGQTDLTVLEHTLGNDLAVSSNGVTLDPDNPVAGDTVTITATVENRSDVPATGIEVAFYDGDPDSGGTLIDTANVTTNGGVLVGGDETEVTVQWLVPASSTPHDIYAVVDPNELLADCDRANNTGVSAGALKPDLAIDAIGVELPSATDRNITVWVTNLSGIEVSNIDITLRRDALDGTVLTTLNVSGPLAPGAFAQVSWLWADAAPFPGPGLELFAIADEANAIDEFDENNNVRSTILRNEVPVFDCNANAYDDVIDLAAGTSQDCNTNGIPDECDIAEEASPDCNANDIPDECDMAAGTSHDCNTNGIPDECEEDCNNNGFADECDIAAGTSPDCNANGTPDECDVAGGASHDCNANGIPDECDDDCNNNGFADECDLAAGTSHDCNANGIPDECDGDCNNNGLADECDIAAGTSEDCNSNSVPDECEIAGGGDVNQDGILDDCQVLGACCDVPQGTCAKLTTEQCATAGGYYLGDGTDCVTGSCPSGQYSNETDLGSFFLFNPGTGVGLADDMTLEGTGARDLVYYDLAVYGNGGGAFDVTAALYTNCPGDGGTLIAGTESAWTGVADDGGAHVLFASPDSVTIADTVWMVVTFSTDQAAWIIAEEPEVGATDDVFGYDSAPWVCNQQFGGDPWSGFWANLRCATVMDCNTNGVLDWQEILAGTSADCNTNSVPDDCDIAAATSYDCNTNNIPDECDITGATSADCNANGTPDECETDCNGNGVPDDCDIAGGTSADCNANAVPDECDITAQTSRDCNSNSIPDECDLAGGTSQDCNTNGTLDECDLADGNSQDCNVNGILDECELAGGSSTDCNTNGVLDDCDIAGATSHDCNTNGTPDECETDCNGNGFADECDLAGGTSQDCNANGTPDECESDCNNNGVADECDITGGTSQDCNANGTPDECESDCNSNGFADECDLAAGTSTDCNANRLPDECDLAGGTSSDTDANGVLDECEDCNHNGVPDGTDVGGGGSADANHNDVPDECEDCNGNGDLDDDDIAGGVSLDCNGDGIPDECHTSQSLVGWGYNGHGETDVPAGDFLAVAVNWNNSVGLRTDGSLVAWGWNLYGECDVPAGNDFVAIDGGRYHNLALKADGSIAAWGADPDHRCDVPAGNDFVAISAGGFHSMALKDNGMVVAWGPNGDRQCRVPTCDHFVAISAGDEHSLALKADGSIVAWGRNEFGQCDVPVGNDFVAIAAGMEHNLAVKADGSLVAWGRNDYGQCDVPPGNDYVDVVAGYGHSLALRANGWPVAWGRNDYGQTDVPPGMELGLVATCGYHYCAVGAGILRDCNGNAVPDDCDAVGGTSDDCNANSVPDECELDCNANGVPDECDITGGTSLDANGDGVPDECVFDDCNYNGIADDLEIASGSSHDCNANGILDVCDITVCTSADCNINGFPDECDIAAGTSPDCNGNGTPDECDLDSWVVEWGSPEYDYGLSTYNPAGHGILDVSAGGQLAFSHSHSLALKIDGSLVGWGDLNADCYGRYVAIDSCARYNMGLRADGSIYVSGSSNYGQITDAPEGNDFIAIAAGEYHCLALKADGSLVGWGYNGYGQADVPAGNDFVSIAAGFYHSLAIKADGSLVGWGSNSDGQINVPAGNDFVAVGAGKYHSVALRADGSLVGWGYNASGQTDVPAGNDFVKITVREYANVALKADHSIVGWGGYGYGVLDLPEGNNFSAVALSNRHGLAIVGGTSKDCNWNTVPDECDIASGASEDSNADGIPDECEFDCNVNAVADVADIALGISPDCNGNAIPDECDLASGTSADCNLNVVPDECDIAGATSADTNDNGIPDECEDCNTNGIPDDVDIAEGTSQDCNNNDVPDECDVDKSLVGWGTNTYGKADVPAGSNFVAIAAGQDHALAVKVDGSLVAWGRNNYGQIDVPTGSDFAAVAAGTWHSVALRDDGSLVGWGGNDYGQADAPAGNNFVAVAAGDYHGVALRTDASLVAWGSNDYDQANAPGGNDFAAVAAGSYHSLAIRTDGSLVGWGRNNHGQINVPAGNDYTALAAGHSVSFALRVDGSIAAWGIDAFGGRLIVDVPTGDGFVAISANVMRALALRADGTLVAWGADYDGGVPLRSDFRGIAAGNAFGLAIVGGTAQDCNENAIPDDCDLAAGTSQDCNTNSIPDECETDCNGNGIADSCDIAGGTSQDTNANGVPDECEDCNNNGVTDDFDIASGTSADCNGTGVPDECELAGGTSADCNNNGFPDECDISGGTSLDTTGNGVPDECEDCNGNGIPDDVEIAGVLYVLMNMVDETVQLYAVDPASPESSTYVGELDQRVDVAYGFATHPATGELYTVVWQGSKQWLAIVDPQTAEVTMVDRLYEPVIDITFRGDGTLLGVTDGNADPPATTPAALVTISTTDATLTETGIVLGVGPGTMYSSIAFLPGTGFLYHSWAHLEQRKLTRVNVDSGEVVLLYSAQSPVLPRSLTFHPSWELCVAGAYAGDLYSLDHIAGDSTYLGAVGPVTQGTPDYLEGIAFLAGGLDCNGNGMFDTCDIAWGISSDANGDGVPDECTDCNQNGVDDFLDLTAGTSLDCNLNSKPDECDIAGGISRDCNGNGTPDQCDLATGISDDCNSNAVPDECDIAAGTSQDCQPNGVPDDCDIAGGTSVDANADGTPDECETDCNTNGVPDDVDIAGGTSQDCNGNAVPDECDIS
ncbi:MAG: matrixin family metalloprotease, partial [Phycisphaerae bacterium]|nr:matrixin family metalloprotease [Phycisphaerae bacterium]